MRHFFSLSYCIILITINSLSQDCLTTDTIMGNNKSGGCSDYTSYIPDPNNLEDYTTLTYKVNVHFFRKSDGTGIFQPSTANQEIADHIDLVNHHYNNLTSPVLPVSPPAEEIPESKVKFEIQNIYWHDDDNFYNYDDACGSHHHNSFATNEDCEINIYYFHSDSLGGSGCASYGYANMMGNDNFVWNWAGTQLLAHELGHAIGLPHTFPGNIGCGDDIFDDTYYPDENLGFTQCGPNETYSRCNGSTGISNNIMGYNLCRNYLSPKQIGYIRHRAITNDSYRKFLKDSYDSNNTIEVNSTQTWDYSKYITGDLIVKSGNTLTVKCKLYFAEESKVIVETGAKLIVDGGYLTNTNTSDCSGEEKLWGGIEVWGQSNLSQFQNNQGEVILKQGAVIEYAEEGVQNWRYNHYNETGGIIRAYNSTFRNCKRAVAFYKYENYYNGNLYNDKSVFQDCQFILDDDFPLSQPHGMASLWNTYGVHFFSNDFIDERSNASAPYGIKSIDAYMIVNGQCNAPISGGCNSVDYGTFENFKIAIDALDASTNNTIRIDRNQFTNNEVGVKISAIDEAEVTRNEFTWNTDLYSGYNSNVGLWLQNASSYQVEENDFMDNQTLHSSAAVGVLNENSGTDNNEIYKNYFEGLYAANWSLNQNRGVGGIKGLEFLCNEYDNTNVSLGGATQLITTTNSNSGNGVKQAFASSASPTGNCHAVQQINNEDGYNNSLYYLSYFYNSQGQTCETPIEYNNMFIPVSTNDDQDCPSRFSTYPPILVGSVLKSAQTGGLISDFESNNASFIALQDSLNDLIDDNNTTYLLNLIGSLETGGNAEEIYGYLSTISPYLSDTVLKKWAFYHPTYVSETWAVDLILDNIDAVNSTDFIDFLENKDTSISGREITTIESEIGQFSTARGEVEQNLMAYGNEKKFAAHYLLRSIQHDSIHNNFDSLQNWYMYNNDDLKDFNIVDVYMRAGDYELAQSYLDSMSSVDYPAALQSQVNDFIILKNAILNLYEDTLTLADLDSTQIANLKLFAENASGRAKYQALNILCFFYDYCNTGVPEFPSIERSMKTPSETIMDPNQENDLMQVKVYPNPANEQLIVQWLEQHPETYSINIKDIQGRSVFQSTSGKETFIWNTSNVTEGIYVLHLYDAKGHFIYSQKISILH